MNFQSKSAIRAATLAAAMLLASQAGAQGQAKGPPGTNPNEFKVVKMTDLKHDYLQRARSLSGASAKAKEWGVFDVTFATAPEWIDGLVATFTVILEDPKADMKKGETKLSLFQTTVEYPHVEKGNVHKIGVVIPPAALARFGTPSGFAVQFSVAGQEIAAQGVTEGMLKSVGEGWWTNPKVLEAPFLQNREGYLVDRMKSPFLLVDIDSYEVSR